MVAVVIGIVLLREYLGEQMELLRFLTKQSAGIATVPSFVQLQEDKKEEERNVF